MPESPLQTLARSVGSAMTRVADEYHFQIPAREEGSVLSVADGVVRIGGLPGASAEQVLRIGRHGTALVLGLRPSAVEAVLLQRPDQADVGAPVRSFQQTAAIPVGDELLGRVVDPLGRPVDGLPLEPPHELMPLERQAPRIFERTDVHTPLYTGVLAVDSMFPVGRGQRELVVGDEGTGKTAFVLDALLRQRETDVVGVYVAVGRRRVETWQLVERLREAGGRWVVVAAPDDLPPGMRYLAPFAGTAIGEYFMHRGEHALVVYDDLSAHAIAWRELSLLLHRPPGREAYPGDIFHLHARLLERAAQLSTDAGGGSLTALPVAVLEGGRLNAYIPTNLISITDGQLVFSRELFVSGQKPAIDASLSVSRVGSRAQAPAFRELAGRLRLEYASFLEVESFSRLGTRLETETQARIETGRRIRALLRAPRLQPLGVWEEVARLVLAQAPELLRVPVDAVPGFAEALIRTTEHDLASVRLGVERDATLPADGRLAVERAISELADHGYPSDDARAIEVTIDVE
ncbi:MAG: F0F1 ATP synthase subunit alpha [Myxococcales bacterium]|nr:F0F1 ATP synthase subunit alpha [Myxococcales bacterium]